MRKLWMSRRRLLLSAAAFLAPAALAGASWNEPSWLRKTAVAMLLEDHDAAKEIGARYLEIAPSERDATRLSNCLFPDGCDVPCTTAGVDALQRRLLKQQQDEFASGDTVVLDGWILARTEARLCALLLVA